MSRATDFLNGLLVSPRAYVHVECQLLREVVNEVGAIALEEVSQRWPENSETRLTLINLAKGIRNGGGIRGTR